MITKNLCRLKIFVLHKFYATAKFLRGSFISKQLLKHNETKINYYYEKYYLFIEIFPFNFSRYS